MAKRIVIPCLTRGEKKPILRRRSNSLLTRAAFEFIRARGDCSNFAVAGLLRILNLYADNPLLSPRLRAEIEDTLLNFCCWFMQAVLGAPAACDFLRVAYQSPSVGEVRFGWTGPLPVAGVAIGPRGYPCFDNPYCQAGFGERRYRVRCGDEQLELDFSP